MKNLKVYLSSLAVFSCLALSSCTEESVRAPFDSYKEAVFYGKHGYFAEDFFKENGIVPIEYYGMPSVYYEVLVAENIYYKDGELVFEKEWVRVDDINNCLGIVRRVEEQFKFIAVDFEGEDPVIKELVTDDLAEVTEEYKYMIEGEPFVKKFSEPYYVNNGKILNKVKGL